MRKTLQLIFFVSALALFCAGNRSLQAASVLSYHNDLTSSGVNPNETTLTPSVLTTSTFFKRFSTPVDGAVYAQPLYVPSVTVVGGAQAGVHNLAIVATQHDSVFAIDADSGVVVWQTSFLSLATSAIPGATSIIPMPAADTGSNDTAPEIGICGTPVIDGSTNYLYAAAKTKQMVGTVANYVYTIYKLDITNGNATANANILASNIIAITSGGYTYRTAASPTAPQDPFVFGTGDGYITVSGTSRVYFNAMRQLNRPGLILYNGTVYAAFGSHGDNGPYHGWLIGFDKNTLAINSALNLTPNGGLGGVWGGGGAPVVDANGYIYLMTGNGKFDGYNNNGVAAGLDSLGFPVNGNYGESVVKIAVDPTTSVGNQNKNGWGLRVNDYFTPYNNQTLTSADTDLGSGACIALPDSAGSSAHPHLLVGAGKQGNIYLIDRDAMGKYNATTDNVLQSFVGIGASFDTPAFFNGVLYYCGVQDWARSFTIANAKMATTPVKTIDQYNWPGATPTISANGATNGIVWMTDRSTAQLRAYAANFTQLWTSAQAANNRDVLDSVAKFAPPTVADGHVMVGTNTALTVYGTSVVATAPPAAPTGLTATAISGLQINLAWTDNANNETGFAIEQSTDGVNFTQIATLGVNTNSYSVINNLQVGTGYSFRVRAFNNYQTLSYSAYSNIASATTLAQPPALNFSSGFAGSTTTLQFNGSAAIANNRAQLTSGLGNQSGSVWSLNPQNIQKFTTQFTFQITNPVADGFTFCIQNNAASTTGGFGIGLGYSGIPRSLAIKFDLYSNAGEGIDSTGLYINGATPTVPATDMTSTGINLHSGNVFQVLLSYDGTTLTEKITDTVTLSTATYTYAINIPSTLGSNTAYVGFTGGTGGASSTQAILTWSYSVLPTAPPAAPTNLVATPASGTQVNLTWTDNSTNESGFVVQRSTSASGPFVQIGVTGPGVASYSDTGLAPNTTYYYEVYATNSAGNSAFTNVASAFTPIPPLTPTNAQPVTITSTSISMTWTNNATNATGYNIFRKVTTASNFSQIASLPATATSYTDNNLTPGTSYDYHIQCYNLAGYSDFSGFTAVTLPTTTVPIVTVTATGPIAVNGVTSGQITFSCGGVASADLPISYTVSGTGVGGSDYTALTGTATIAAGSSSVNVPVTALPGATSGATVTVATTATANYTVGTPTSATVVIGNPTYNATAGTAYGVSPVSGTTGGSVTLNFAGLPGSPSGVVYVWYLNGAAFTTTTTGSYTLTNAIPAQSGTYAVYAYAPGGATGSASWTVTITDPILVINPSVSSLTVNDGSTASFTVSLATAPTATTTVSVGITGTPAITVSPSTLTMTPTSYQNQTVTVSAAAINSNDSNRSATVSLTDGAASASVGVTDVVSDTQTAANLAGTSYALAGANIGTGSAGDSSVHASGNWWIDGSGASGLSTSADSFHFESESYTGNFQMIVNLQSLVATGATTPLAGLMIRDGTAAGSNFLALAGTATATGPYSLISRTTVNTIPANSTTTQNYTYPAAWMMLTRVGSVLHAFVSPDGVNYTEVTNPSSGITWTGMSTALNIGLFSSSGSSANARAVFNNFSITGAASPIVLLDADIGGPSLAGSATLNSGTYTVTGSGADIWGASDQFNYDSASVSGDFTIVVEVNSQSYTSYWAKSGIMMRSSSAANSPYVAVYVNPSNFCELQWRDTAGGQASYIGHQTAPPSGTTVKWLELVKSGSSYSSYFATTTTVPTAANWLPVGTHTAPTNPTTYLAGLAVCSNNSGTLNTTVFSQLTFQLAGGVITTPPVLTNLALNKPVTVSSTEAGPNVAANAVDGNTATRWSSAYSDPQWIVVDLGANYNISEIDLNWEAACGMNYQIQTSTDAVNWSTQNNVVGNTTTGVIKYPYATPVVGRYVRMYGTARATVWGYSLWELTVLGDGTIGTLPPPPPGYTDVDIGSPAIAGSEVTNGTTEMISGNGNDIWGTSDQFNYYYQTNTTDVTIIAHVDSITNTSYWARAGLMFRNSTAAGSAFVGFYQNPNFQVELQWRDSLGGSAAWGGTQVGPSSTAKWLKLVKSGTTFTAYYATTTGTPGTADWVLAGTHTSATFTGTYLGGLAVTSQNTGQLNTAVFSGLSQQ